MLEIRTYFYPDIATKFLAKIVKRGDFDQSVQKIAIERLEKIPPIDDVHTDWILTDGFELVRVGKKMISRRLKTFVQTEKTTKNWLFSWCLNKKIPYVFNSIPYS